MLWVHLELAFLSPAQTQDPSNRYRNWCRLGHLILEITTKINLAKKYLEAGDKESARAILLEVIAVAKDAQKLEAEIILSGIL